MDIEKFITKFITNRQESLLKKDFLKFEDELKGQINNKTVLVIGGAGSIGSEYIKVLLRFEIKKLIVVDINENSLTELVRDIRSSDGYNIPDEFITYPIDFGSKVFEKLFNEHGPFDIVANFAAHKHVRSEKDIYSVEAMLENNVFKAKKLLDLLLQNPPEHFFCVSTDKAANPVNIMGASKKLMEELILAYSDDIPVNTARFANVAFSNGSLLAGFLERLNKKQPWSCPIGIKRFFVSPIESGELCLAATVLGDSGEIFYPLLDPEKDMIPFDQIALNLKDYLGVDVDIHFSEPTTSGEKSFEEFFTENDDCDESRFHCLGVISNTKKKSRIDVLQAIEKIKEAFDKDISKRGLVKLIKSHLPDFDHIETGISLDSKM